ncbi:hypothetical protein HRW13_35700 [Streptomyces lunaelactis]|uniref:hypothetical protein n=1 Tax=Streptomyces lunaelactis TaxID=1535768 RepID=UPI00158577F6|nr:hypothetical protein [Streptomyces lunaelactis]NUK46097.1 hypothetical protein [Streptomyces lunaelactis]
MTDDRRGDDVQVASHGEGAPAIGKVGKLFLSVFVGDPAEFIGNVKRWSGWNWPPFFLVITLGAVALIIAPGGPTDQFLWVYFAIGAAVVVAFCRVIGVGSRDSSAVWRALMTGGSLLLAVLGIVGMDHLADHGEVDVTGRTRISPATGTNGSGLRVVGNAPPERAQLRLVLTVADAVPGAQSCTPDTEMAVQLPNNANTLVADVTSGQPVEFPLGGLRDRIVVDVDLLTEDGCRMSVSVAEAALHD